jgi:UDP-glucuronate 4-epimerase
VIPKSILITGASGFIGQHVVRHLAELGHQVTALDFRPPSQPHPGSVQTLHCDIRQDPLPDRTFSAVVHLAALAGVRPSMDLPVHYEETNVLGTIRLLEFCREKGIKQFVFASSSSIYGPNKGMPSVESDQPTPLSPYALTKQLGEQWGDLYARVHGIRFVALRLFSVWGEGQRPDLALEKFQRKIRSGETITIHGDGSQRRDMTHVSDVCRAISLAIDWKGAEWTAFNIGTGTSHSVLETVKLAECFTGQKARIEHGPAHPADVPETLASPVKARNLLGWEPKVRVPDGHAGSLKKV